MGEMELIKGCVLIEVGAMQLSTFGSIVLIWYSGFKSNQYKCYLGIDRMRMASITRCSLTCENARLSSHERHGAR